MGEGGPARERGPKTDDADDAEGTIDTGDQA